MDSSVRRDDKQLSIYFRRVLSEEVSSFASLPVLVSCLVERDFFLVRSHSLDYCFVAELLRRHVMMDSCGSFRFDRLFEVQM